MKLLDHVSIQSFFAVACYQGRLNRHVAMGPEKAVNPAHMLQKAVYFEKLPIAHVRLPQGHAKGELVEAGSLCKSRRTIVQGPMCVQTCVKHHFVT